MQSLRDTEDLANQGNSGDVVTTGMELSARVQELEQQIVDLKAELQQKEVESGGFEDADSVIASRELLNLDEDDTIGIPTRLNTSFPSPPPTMPNTPCKYSPSRNARVPGSILNPDSANEVLNNRLRSELELRKIGPVNDTPDIAQSSIVRPRRGKGDHEAPVVGVRERRQGTRWMRTLVPFFSPSASRE
ncbi:hypothetical protein B0O99DRAFT_694678 [Bisporella sp. PMI_857]|nr:hypothetical protein B0O99DRAFT_694678 [Bisporella sp. PMI_857]